MAVVTSSSAVLFIDKNKLDDEVITHLSSSSVTISPYEDIQPYLSTSLKAELGADGKILLDPNLCSLTLFKLISTEVRRQG